MGGERSRRTLALAPLVSVFACVTWLSGCDGGSRGSADERVERIVLVSIDTLRADHVGCYGAEGAETPALDALAVEGVRFSTAISPAPTHASVPRHAAHRPRPAATRGASQWLLPLGGRRADARRARARRGLRHRRVRLGLRAGRPIRPRARLRRLRRPARHAPHLGRTGRGARTARRPHRGCRARLARGRARALLPLGAPLRPARGVRAACAVERALHGPALRGRDRLHGRAARAAPHCSRGALARGNALVGHLRPRREPRRARREDALLRRLRGDAARAAHRGGAGSPARGGERRRGRTRRLRAECARAGGAREPAGRERDQRGAGAARRERAPRSLGRDARDAARHGLEPAPRRAHRHAQVRARARARAVRPRGRSAGAGEPRQRRAGARRRARPARRGARRGAARSSPASSPMRRSARSSRRSATCRAEPGLPPEPHSARWAGSTRSEVPPSSRRWIGSRC